LSETRGHHPGLKGLEELVKSLKRFDAGRIHTTPWLQAQLPRSWRERQKDLNIKEGIKPDLVRVLENPLLVIEQGKAPDLERSLKNILRQPYQREEAGDWVVFSVPRSSFDYRPISPKAWSFQSNYNQPKASLAADGKISTRWTMDRPQVPGAYFQIDLRKAEKVARIRLLAGDSRNDYPRRYSLRYSTDGRTWASLDPYLSPVSLYWTGETLLKGGEDLDLTFPPTEMRHLKIVQTGQDEVYYWSIHEVELYEKLSK
jgi:hypothetical protein